MRRKDLLGVHHLLEKTIGYPLLEEETLKSHDNKNLETYISLGKIISTLLLGALKNHSDPWPESDIN